MFTSWTRHGKPNNGIAEGDRTPSNRQVPTIAKSTAYHLTESLIPNKPKGRRLTDDSSYSKESSLLEYSRDHRQSRDTELKEQEHRQHTGVMSTDISRMISLSQFKARMRGPSSSGTALSAASYQILLPQKSSPLEPGQAPIKFQQETPVKFPVDSSPKFQQEPAPYPTWTMSMGIPQTNRRIQDLRKRLECGPNSTSLVSDNRAPSSTISTPCAPIDPPSIMVDPYSSSAREFIASRQLLYLTRRRVRTTNCEPQVWIVNYYGRAAAKALHSKVVPGSSLTIADAVAMGKQQRSDQPRLSRLLGYQEVDDSNPIQEKGKLRFLRLIGRGGTSAVYSGLMEVCWENAMMDSPSPVVAKILNPKHWKCALAELVASAATIHRLSEGVVMVPDRRRMSSSRSDGVSPAASSSGTRYDTSPFVQGGTWLMPTELHLFWDFDSPVANEWSPVKKKIDANSHPRFSQNELPSLCCLVLRNCEDGVPLLTWLNTVYVKSASPYANRHVPHDQQIAHPLLAQSSSRLSPVTVAGIDFGRSLDIKECLRDVIFIGDTQVSDFRCPPMLEKSRWETQIDLTGLAVTIFTMISLKYPKIRKKKMDAVHMPSLSVGEAKGKVNHSYWFGSRIRGDLRQNDFWLGILDRLINFDPFHTSDGHTILDSCLLLRQLEKELVGLFHYRPTEVSSSALRANYDTLYSELNEMHDFILDYQKRGGGLSGPPVMI